MATKNRSKAQRRAESQASGDEPKEEQPQGENGRQTQPDRTAARQVKRRKSVAAKARSRGAGDSARGRVAVGVSTSPERAVPKRRGRPGSNAREGKEQPSASGGGTTAKAARAVKEQVKEHPLLAAAATAAVGVGLGTLLLRGGRRVLGARDASEATRTDRTEERFDKKAGMSGRMTEADAPDEHDREDGKLDALFKGGFERAAALGDAGRRGLSQIGSAVRSGAATAGQKAKQGYGRSVELAEEGWDSHPLLVAAAVLAAGTVAGLLLPATRVEDDLMGKAADRVGGRVKDAAQSLVGLGKQVAAKALTEVTGNITDRAVERVGLTSRRLAGGG